MGPRKASGASVLAGALFSEPASGSIDKELRMITIWGEGRGIRVAWLLEEMGLPYKLRPVDLMKGAENDPEFLAINPAGYIPALQDGDVVMVESIAIMEYLTARYGPTPLAPGPSDPTFPLYLQFLLMGEAGLASSIYFVLGARLFAPPDQRDNWTAGQAQRQFDSRLGLVKRQLARAPYMAGEAFTAADISVTYALMLARRNAGVILGPAEDAYVTRTTARDAFQRAMEMCPATKALYTGAPH
jgi:glutathione S-transferase